MKILDGRRLATRIKNEVREEIKKLGVSPGLAPLEAWPLTGLVALLVGEDPASHLYVNLKEKACLEAGIRFEKKLFPADLPQPDLIAEIKKLNERPEINAILVQSPLPLPLNEDEVMAAIDPKKDVDGFHPENLTLLLEGRPRIIPGVSRGIVELVKSANIPLKGKVAALVVNSTTFALPIQYLLEQAGVIVHILHAPPDFVKLRSQLLASDIIVIAVGRPAILTVDYIKEGAVLIDVGTNRLTDGKVIGDVDFESVKQKAGAISPVPGGVGPMTVAMLLDNVVRLTPAPRVS